MNSIILNSIREDVDNNLVVAIEVYGDYASNLSNDLCGNNFNAQVMMYGNNGKCCVVVTKEHMEDISEEVYEDILLALQLPEEGCDRYRSVLIEDEEIYVRYKGNVAVHDLYFVYIVS